MSFQAYLDAVEAKTGKTPEELRRMAAAKGLADAEGLARDVKATEALNWLKTEFGLGHGHAMSIVAFLKGKRE